MRCSICQGDFDYIQLKNVSGKAVCQRCFAKRQAKGHPRPNNPPMGARAPHSVPTAKSSRPLAVAATVILATAIVGGAYALSSLRTGHIPPAAIADASAVTNESIASNDQDNTSSRISVVSTSSMPHDGTATTQKAGATSTPVPQQKPSDAMVIRNILAAGGEVTETLQPAIIAMAASPINPDSRAVAQHIVKRLEAGRQWKLIAEVPVQPNYGDVYISPDGSNVVYNGGGTHENEMFRLNVDSKNTIGFGTMFSSLSFIGSDRVVSTVFDSIQIESVSTAKELSHFVIPTENGASFSGHMWAAASPSGALIAYAAPASSTAKRGNAYPVYVLDTATGRVADVLSGHNNPASGGAFDPTGSGLLVTTELGYLYVWDLTIPGGKLMHRIRAQAQQANNGAYTVPWIAITQAHQLFHYPTQSETLEVIDLVSGKQTAFYGVGKYLRAFGVSPFGGEVLFSRAQPDVPVNDTAQPVESLIVAVGTQCLGESAWKKAVLSKLDNLKADGVFNVIIMNKDSTMFKQQMVKKTAATLKALDAFLNDSKSATYGTDEDTIRGALKKAISSKPQRIDGLFLSHYGDFSDVLLQAKQSGIDAHSYWADGEDSSPTFPETRGSIRVHQGRTKQSEREFVFELWDTERQKVNKTFDGVHFNGALSADGTTVALLNSERLTVLKATSAESWKDNALVTLKRFLDSKVGNGSTADEAMLVDAASGLGDRQTAARISAIETETAERKAREKAAIEKENRQAEVRKGTPRFIAQQIIDSAISKGVLQDAVFVNYFEPGGLAQWDRLPNSVNSLGVRYQFKFVTQAGLVRQYNGYFGFERGAGGWHADRINVDGMGDIPAKVFTDGGFVIR